MKKYLYPSVLLLLFFTCTLGIGYPLFMTLLGNTFWDFQAQGSLAKMTGIIVGSELIGQNWQEPIYFHGRPSVSKYQPMLSGASNLSPISLKVDQQPALNQELVLSSGSGLDPHLSKDAIFSQIPRVARARKINDELIKTLVLSLVEKKTFGVLGEERVNVLKLNMELDQIE